MNLWRSRSAPWPALLAAGWWAGGWRAGARRLAILLGAVLLGSSFFWLPVLVDYEAFGGFPARVASEVGIRPLPFARVAAVQLQAVAGR